MACRDRARGARPGGLTPAPVYTYICSVIAGGRTMEVKRVHVGVESTTNEAGRVTPTAIL